MPVSKGYKAFVIEQLSHFANISSRHMFSGVGLYADEFFFALIFNDRLYFKVDDSNQPDFEAKGMGPFRPYSDERTMNYYEVPIDVLEDVDELKKWCEKAVRVSKNCREKVNPDLSFYNSKFKFLLIQQPAESNSNGRIKCPM